MHKHERMQEHLLFSEGKSFGKVRTAEVEDGSGCACFRRPGQPFLLEAGASSESLISSLTSSFQS
jgi:hypothetical protein